MITNYIQMQSGARVYVDPETMTIDEEKSNFYLDDLAHALSNLCRFAGHTRTFYSVAQHSVLVARIVGENAAISADFDVPSYNVAVAQALFHDASEAILADIPKPMKNLLPDYQKLEQQVQAWIMRTMGLPEEDSELMKLADRVALATESLYLMGENMAPELEPIPMVIVPLHPASAEGIFVRAADQALARCTSFTSDHFSQLVLNPSTFSRAADAPSGDDAAPTDPELGGDVDSGDLQPVEESDPGQDDVVDREDNES
jgi:hypothetical protein